MIDEAQFLGHPPKYWLELERRFKAENGGLRANDLLEEVIELRGRIAFYESRIDEMVKIKQRGER